MLPPHPVSPWHRRLPRPFPSGSVEVWTVLALVPGDSRADGWKQSSHRLGSSRVHFVPVRTQPGESSPRVRCKSLQTCVTGSLATVKLELHEIDWGESTGKQKKIYIMLEQKQVPVFFTRFNLWNKNIFPAVCVNYNTCIYCVLLGLLDMKYSLHAKNTNKIYFAGLPDAAAWKHFSQFWCFIGSCRVWLHNGSCFVRSNVSEGAVEPELERTSPFPQPDSDSDSACVCLLSLDSRNLQIQSNSRVWGIEGNKRRVDLPF